LVGWIARVPLIIATRHNVNIGGAVREWINRGIKDLRDMTVAISEEVHEAERERARVSGDRITLIQNGIPVKTLSEPNQAQLDAVREEWDILPHMPVVGTLARFHQQKGLPYLLESAAQVRQECPELKLLLVGDGGLRSSLEEQARDLGLSGCAILPGIRHDVPEILALVDVFVLPSLWEGLPIALLEAMAASLPVVATAVGGVPEVVVDGVTGLLVPPRDPEALSKAILTLLKDRDLQHSMGQAGRERVTRCFSVERMVKETEVLYESMMTRKGLL
jgi:glycosyltransferase involved in cell wall biosynthesis